jgi:hypothetical protein
VRLGGGATRRCERCLQGPATGKGKDKGKHAQSGEPLGLKGLHESPAEWPLTPPLYDDDDGDDDDDDDDDDEDEDEDEDVVAFVGVSRRCGGRAGGWRCGGGGGNERDAALLPPAHGHHGRPAVQTPALAATGGTSPGTSRRHAHTGTCRWEIAVWRTLILYRSEDSRVKIAVWRTLISPRSATPMDQPTQAGRPGQHSTTKSPPSLPAGGAVLRAPAGVRVVQGAAARRRLHGPAAQEGAPRTLPGKVVCRINTASVCRSRSSGLHQ